jgi:hypothetical protein
MRRTTVRHTPEKRTSVRMRARRTPAIEVEIDEGIDGHTAADATDYAEKSIGALVKYCSKPLRHARIRITRAPRLIGRSVVAHANLDVDGRPVLAHAVGTTPRETVDLLQANLRAQLMDSRSAWRKRSTQDVPTRCYVARSHTRLVGPMSLSQAVSAMAELDYDFCLFTEQVSGQDSALQRMAPDRYRLIQVSRQQGELGPAGVAIDVDERPAPAMTEAEAIAVLRTSGARMVFFRDRIGGRGHLLYRRAHGNYGLLIPT